MLAQHVLIGHWGEWVTRGDTLNLLRGKTEDWRLVTNERENADSFFSR